MIFTVGLHAFRSFISTVNVFFYYLFFLASARKRETRKREQEEKTARTAEKNTLIITRSHRDPKEMTAPHFALYNLD